MKSFRGDDGDDELAKLCMIVLRKRRIELGITQGAISKTIGVHWLGSYCRMESGKNRLRMDGFFCICRTLEIAPETVIDRARLMSH